MRECVVCEGMRECVMCVRVFEGMCSVCVRECVVFVRVCEAQRLTNANTVLHAYVSASVFGGVRTSAVIGFRSPCVD